eukprot:TRINITY_DN25121_c0_g1_i1.p1 TRINITY_DN25121_c0_g1~~TRINITY_DN25121_c0_g1_i1.p1  ORF type:complete len:193 (-),score=66.56 TRINITY_DN25121_c0_g1_i1:76-654(-)
MMLEQQFPDKEILDAYMFPQVDRNKEEFSWAVPNLNQLRMFLAEKFGWSREKTDEKILPVIQRYNSETGMQQQQQAKFQQSSLFTFFSKVPQKREPIGTITNKRMLNVIALLKGNPHFLEESRNQKSIRKPVKRKNMSGDDDNDGGGGGGNNVRGCDARKTKKRDRGATVKRSDGTARAKRRREGVSQGKKS